MIEQVVILAGGLGTRLKPITEKIPKPLVEVAGRPFLEWQLADVTRQGYRKVLLLVAYLGEKIVDHFGDGSRFGLDIAYSFEPEPLGTGGALKLALSKLDAQFILLNGDSFLPAPFAKMAKAFEGRGGLDALISTYVNTGDCPVPENLGLNSEGLVIAYKKAAGKAAGFSHIDSGVYILSKKLLEQAPEGKFQLEELWPQLIQRHTLGTFEVNSRFYDIGTPERLEEFARYLGGEK